jgi:hypothetical protein
MAGVRGIGRCSFALAQDALTDLRAPPSKSSLKNFELRSPLVRKRTVQPCVSGNTENRTAALFEIAASLPSAIRTGGRRVPEWWGTGVAEKQTSFGCHDVSAIPSDRGSSSILLPPPVDPRYWVKLISYRWWAL